MATRKALWRGLAPALLVALLAAFATGGREAADPIELLGVVDGDGLRVRHRGRVELLRLACVDCEESLHASDRAARDKPQTVLGERARLWLAHLLRGSGEDAPELVFAPHPGEPERDGFGRLLGHVRLADGRDLGLELVRAGHSPYFVKYGACPLADADYRAAERAARAARRGVWHPAANRPAASDAPWARRDYARLAPWWELRADAVAGYRARRTRDPLAVARADAREELARAAQGSAAVFLEVVAARADADGALELACAGGLLTVHVPADARAHFAPLELERRGWSGRANHLWLRARPRPAGGAWRATCAAPGDLLDADRTGPR